MRGKLSTAEAQSDGDICANCRNYRPGKLEFNCREKGTVGPLWKMSCFEKIVNDMEIDANAPKMKTCSRCGKELPLEKFGRNVRAADGYQKICLDCFKEALKAGTKKKGKPKAKAAKAAKEAADLATAAANAAADAANSAADAAASMSSLRSAAIDLLKGFADKELANELRARGWDVSCTKTTVIEI